MTNAENKPLTIEEIREKMQVGDWTTLGKALKCLPDAARKRFDREKPEAIEAMTKIIEARENVIENLQNKDQ